MSSAKEWRATNPLRKFRDKAGIALTDAAAALAVSTVAVQNWERGTSTPNDSNTTNIARLMETDVPKLSRAWERWIKSRPAMKTWR